MTTKTKIIIGLAVLSAGAAAYYFLVYKPKQKQPGKDGAGTSGAAAPTGGRLNMSLTDSGSAIFEEQPQIWNNPVKGDPKYGYYKDGEWYWYR